MSYYACGSMFAFEHQAADAVADALLPDVRVIGSGEDLDTAAEELCRYAESEARKIGEELGGNPADGTPPSREAIVAAVVRRIIADAEIRAR